MGLSRESLIVVVVVAAVSAAVTALVLLYFILRSRRNSAAPLPPVQPLARHRQSTWHGDQLLPPGTLSSSSSLLHKYSPPSRPSSSVPDVPLPSRSFQDLAQSSSSFLSTDTDFPSTLQLSPPSSLPRHPRPLSTSSSNTAATPISRATSRNTLRGVPYNQIQIVLPAPLAPSPHIYPCLQGDLHGGARLSAVDMWVPVGRDNLGTGSPGLRSHINSRSSLRISSPPLPFSSRGSPSVQHPFYQSPDITTTPEKM